MPFYDKLTAVPPREPTLQERIMNDPQLNFWMPHAVESACSSLHAAKQRRAQGWLDFRLDYTDNDAGVLSVRFIPGKLDDLVADLHSGKAFRSQWANNPHREHVMKYFPEATRTVQSIGWDRPVTRIKANKDHADYWEYTMYLSIGVSFAKAQMEQLFRLLQQKLAEEHVPEGSARLVGKKITVPDGYNFFTGHNNAWRDMGVRWFIEIDIRW